MKLHPRLLTGSMSLTAIAALLGGAYLLITEPWRPRQRLPDGSVLTLWDSTYGKQHQFDERQGWRRLRPVGSTQRGTTGPLFTHATGRDALVLWMSRTGTPRRDETRLFGSGPTDDHGCRFGTTRLEEQSASWTSQQLGELSAVPLEVFPRRGTSVALEFQDLWNGQLRARFAVANPAQASYPVWNPEPYPITKRSGPVTVTLQRLRHVDEERWQGTMADYTASENGRPTRNWVALNVAVSDATGNSLWAPVPGSYPGGLYPLPGLCRKETAWKVRTAFAPADPTRSPADYVWKVEGIAAPRADGETTTPRSFERPGLSLSLDRVMGVDIVQCRVWFPKKPLAVASVTAVGEGLRLTLLQATDDQGRNLMPPRGSGVAPGMEGAASHPYWLPEQTHHFGLVIPKRARKLNLTFAVHKARTVEFLAKP